MIEKNKKGNLKKITLDNIDLTQPESIVILRIIQRQKEIEKTLNFILAEIQSGLKRTNKF